MHGPPPLLPMAAPISNTSAEEAGENSTMSPSLGSGSLEESEMRSFALAAIAGVAEGARTRRRPLPAHSLASTGEGEGEESVEAGEEATGGVEDAGAGLVTSTSSSDHFFRLRRG